MTIFARATDDALASLVKEIDKLVAEKKDKQLAAVVNFIGEPTDEMKAKIKDFGEKHDLKNVALVVTKDADAFKISDEAEVTVMHYKDKKVKFNAAAAKGALNKKAIDAIVAGLPKILE